MVRAAAAAYARAKAAAGAGLKAADAHQAPHLKRTESHKFEGLLDELQDNESAFSIEDEISEFASLVIMVLFLFFSYGDPWVIAVGVLVAVFVSALFVASLHSELRCRCCLDARRRWAPSSTRVEHRTAGDVGRLSLIHI